MEKRLEEMSIEELWTLFPIVLREYNPAYPAWYERERARLESLLGKENIFRVSHVGSTAVPGLLCKPTVDILAELSPAADVEKAVSRLQEEWILMSGEVSRHTPVDAADRAIRDVSDNKSEGAFSDMSKQISGAARGNSLAPEPVRLVFNKGYTPRGFAEKVFHLHLRSAGDWDEPYFRDYLREHAEARREYADLKRGLRLKYERDRDGYTAAKSEFVRKYTAKARALYGGRYLPGK